MAERDAIADIRRGVALAVCAVALFTVMMALVKWLSTSFAPMQIAFFRAFCAMVLCLPVVLADSGIAGLRTRHPGAYVLRGLVGCGSIATSFYGVTLLPIADWVALTFMVPLFVAAMSAPMLGEKVGRQRWAAILVGFAGILIIVPPTGSASLWALSVGITAQVLVSFALVLIRRMSDTERTTTIVFYYMLALVVVTAVTAPFDWRPPEGVQWLLLILVGVVAGSAHLLITAAYRLAPASVIAPFDYTGIVWAMLIGWFFWHEKPDANLFLGVPLVIASGLYVVISATRRPAAPA
jgi:drug/metabolite transporter (DMT)-like permease